MTELVRLRYNKTTNEQHDLISKTSIQYWTLLNLITIEKIPKTPYTINKNTNFIIITYKGMAFGCPTNILEYTVLFANNIICVSKNKYRNNNVKKENTSDMYLHAFYDTGAWLQTSVHE